MRLSRLVRIPLLVSKASPPGLIMATTIPKKEASKKPSSSLLSLLKPYTRLILLLILFALISNGVNLVLPMLISHGIDDYSAGKFVLRTMVIEFLVAALLIFI